MSSWRKWLDDYLAALELQLEDLVAAVCQGGESAQLGATNLGSPQASVDPIPDPLRLKISHLLAGLRLALRAIPGRIARR
jgi:hypothetical protein